MTCSVAMESAHLNVRIKVARLRAKCGIGKTTLQDISSDVERPWDTPHDMSLDKASSNGKEEVA
jgi:hypothetical protein